MCARAWASSLHRKNNTAFVTNVYIRTHKSNSVFSMTNDRWTRNTTSQFLFRTEIKHIWSSKLQMIRSAVFERKKKYVMQKVKYILWTSKWQIQVKWFTGFASLGKTKTDSNLGCFPSFVILFLIFICAIIHSKRVVKRHSFFKIWLNVCLPILWSNL